MGQSHFIEQTPYRELLSYRLKISRYRKIVTFDRKRWYSRDSCILSIFLSVSTPRNFWRILFVCISMRNKDNNKIVEINRKRRIMKKKKTIKNKIFVRDTESPSFGPFIRSRLFLVARFSSWKIEEKMQERLKNWKLVASIFETRHLHSFVLIEPWIVNWTLRIIDFYRYVPLLEPNVLVLNTAIT